MIADCLGRYGPRPGRHDLKFADTLGRRLRGFEGGGQQMRDEQDPTPLRYDQTGLRGRLARVLVEEPTDEIDWPADLPAGIETVVILDDGPNPHHTLRVHPPGDPTRVALVVFDQLALCEDLPEA
ncbi:DUF7161 family protein [Micromonospora avicenniae]|nr:hypothetical protein [Micromonospora avicenniae]